MTETLYATVLDGVYESMPSLPGLVLTARLLNRQQKRDDTPQNSLEAIMEMTHLLCSIDLKLLEKKHYENTSEFPGPAPPKRSIVASRVDAQLAEVAELDKRLRAANESLKAAMEDHRRTIAESRKMLSEVQEGHEAFSGGARDIFGGDFYAPGNNPWLLTLPVDWSEGGSSLIDDLMRQFTVDDTRTTPSNSPEDVGTAPPTTVAATAATPTPAAADVVSAPVVAVSDSSEEEAYSSQPATEKEPDMPPRPTRLRRSRRFDADS